MESSRSLHPGQPAPRSERLFGPRSVWVKSRRALRALLTRTIELESDSIPYQLRDVPLRKVLNWILVEAGITLRRKRPWGYPTHFQIEPTTYCNLRCPLCPVTEGMDRATGHMSPELFRRLIDETGEYALIALLWDWGEPFVHPQIYDLISYAKAKNVALVCSTNGHTFAKEESARRLVRSGLDTVIFAVDGVTQESYQQYRYPGNLEIVLQGIRNVVAQRKALQSETPLIVFRFIVMRQNELEIPELKHLAYDLGVDVLSLKSLNPYANDVYHENREERQDDYHAFLPEDPAYHRFRYVEEGGNLHRIRRTPPCKNLWNCPTIHFDGHVCPCTYDYNESHLHGDLSRQSFKDIWYGDSYTRMREQFLEDSEELAACRFYHERVAARFERPDSPGRVARLTKSEGDDGPRHQEATPLPVLPSGTGLNSSTT